MKTFKNYSKIFVYADEFANHGVEISRYVKKSNAHVYTPLFKLNDMFSSWLLINSGLDKS